MKTVKVHRYRLSIEDKVGSVGILDLWNYYALCSKGNGLAIREGATVDEIEDLKKAIIESNREPTLKEKDALERCLERFGPDWCLFAIEECAAEDASVLDLEDYCQQVRSSILV